MALTDPYQVLGVPHSATDAEIRAAYRRLVQLHHPDHNGGSPESARRFEQVQEAYALIQKLKRPGARSRPTATNAKASSTPPPSGSGDPGLAQRLADLERDLVAQRRAKQEATRRAEQAREQALREARRATEHDRPSDEELGYVTTDDSFSAILDDAADGWAERRRSAGDDGAGGSERRHGAANERLADLFDDLGARLRGERRKRPPS